MSVTDSRTMDKVVDGLPTTSAKIRALDAEGFSRSEIAKFLGKRYQHVRNVLVQGPPQREEQRSEGASPDTLVKKRIITKPVRVQIGAGGRIVIPAEMRKAMGVEEGDTLAARVEDGVLMLMSADTAIRKAQEIVRRYVPEGVSLVDELIAERRAEADA